MPDLSAGRKCHAMKFITVVMHCGRCIVRLKEVKIDALWDWREVRIDALWDWKVIRMDALWDGKEVRIDALWDWKEVRIDALWDWKVIRIYALWDWKEVRIDALWDWREVRIDALWDTFCPLQSHNASNLIFLYWYSMHNVHLLWLSINQVIIIIKIMMIFIERQT